MSGSFDPKYYPLGDYVAFSFSKYINLKTLKSTVGAGLLALGLGASASAQDVMIQYFETSWQTMERRMPDVFMAGYDGVWVPPPGKADSGGFSVGYDAFDRFNLGTPNDRTLYGTEDGFGQLSDQMDRAGLNLYIDTILNHNGFRTQDTPGFVEAGDYPGFVTTDPNAVDGDFNSPFNTDVLTERLAGLIDINQATNLQFTRHPVPGEPNNITNETPLESNRQFYPDQGLPFEEGRPVYNLNDPMAGDPYQENATGILLRYLQYMVEVHGVDGFRLDAVRHIPTFFFNDFYDPQVFNLARNPIDDSPVTPFSFGENFTSDFGSLNAYVRKDGFGNRDALDFPLFFTMESIANGGGFGDMRALEFASYDSSDGDANDGSRGVLFANSHDSATPGDFGGLSNMLFAHILTRTGFPVVYYNAREFGDGRDFPKAGRGDALGNFNSDIFTTLVTLNGEYARGAHFTRWIDPDVYIYERSNHMLVGLNDNGAAGFDERTVLTNFAPGTVLVELTGNATNSFVDPGDDIFDSVTVDQNQNVTIRVPRNSSSSGNHARGYVIYGPEVPRADISITNDVGTLGPDPLPANPSNFDRAVRRLTELPIVTGDTIDVELQVDANGPQEKFAAIKLNYGLDIDGTAGVNATGPFAGFEEFTSNSYSNASGTGTHTISIDATGLEEGYQYIETRALLDRDGEDLYDEDRLVVYLDRVAPDVDLLFPTQTGNMDITTRSYEAVFETDATANSVHVFTGLDDTLTDQQIIGMVSGDTEARQNDRKEWRYVLDNLPNGELVITVVAFEETGNASVTHFDNIDVNRGLPDLLLGIDTNLNNDGVTFEGFPGSIQTPLLVQEVVVRVDTQNVGGRDPISFGDGDYTVTLQIDDEDPIEAQGYDAGLLPPVGILVQNDQNLGDQFDEFRFLWRGYSAGNHTLTARAELTDMTASPNEFIAFTNVPESVDGPPVTLTKPSPPSETFDNPSIIEVEGTFDSSFTEFAQIFFDTPEGSFLLDTIEDPQPGPFSVTRDIGSYALQDVLPLNSIQTANGTFGVRVVATTGENGTGIVNEVGADFVITGQFEPENLPSLQTDGDAEDFLGLPVLAVSAADGSGGMADPADFAGDGSLIELRAGFRDNVLGVGIRGEFFGETNENNDNASFVYLDVNSGSGQGVRDIATEVNDFQDGLRSDISNSRFSLDPSLSDNGFDVLIGATTQNIIFGYGVGTDGLGGSTTAMEFLPGILAGFGSGNDTFPAAPGTTYAAPEVIELRIPLDTIGNPNPNAIALASTTANDDGFPSPNTLPENSSNAFDDSQIIEALAMFPVQPPILINELLLTDVDQIELYNPNEGNVDISGWALRMDDSADVQRDYVFPENTIIGPNEYFVVSDIGVSSKGTSPLQLSFNIPWDQSRAGSIALVDQFGIGKDYVSWLNVAGDQGSTITNRVPAGTLFAGLVNAPDSTSSPQSLARDAMSTDTDDASDWNNLSGVDAMAPTIGFQNTTQVQDTEDYWLYF